jgi:hypothetical protein
MTDKFNRRIFGSVTVGRNYAPNHHFPWRAEHAIYVSTELGYGSTAIDLDQAKAMRNHLDVLIMEIEAGLEEQNTTRLRDLKPGTRFKFGPTGPDYIRLTNGNIWSVRMQQVTGEVGDLNRKVTVIED